MNEELAKHLIPLVDLAKDGVIKAVEIAQAQLPDLVKQIFAWEITVAWLGIAVCMIAFSIGIISWVVGQKTGWDNEGILTFTVFFTIMPSIWIWCPIVKLLKIYVAPKLWLMNYLTNFLK
jgi:hypothetical protein